MLNADSPQETLALWLVVARAIEADREDRAAATADVAAYQVAARKRLATARPPR